MLVSELLTENIDDKGILKAMFLAGTPGAGKSYTISAIKDGSIEPKIINTDKYFEHIGKKLGADLTADAKANNIWQMYADKIKVINRNALALYLNAMLPLIIDGTSVNPNNLLLRVGILESLGYDTTMVYIETDLETALKRNAQRDRRVPEDFIKRSFDEIKKSEEFYKSKFSKFFKIDNNDGMLTDKAIKEAFKKSSSFFNGAVSNPVGRKVIEQLRSEKQKYLIPTIITKTELDAKLDLWYRR